jgi:putative protein-disulfide isomerase
LSSATLHFIFDPLCGWCYGAAPLVDAAAGVKDLELELHAGCLWPEPTRLPEDMRGYIQQADARIAAMSGQAFGAAYLEGLLLDPELVLESRPVIAAMLAARALDPGLALSMLRGIQHAHYVQGRHVVRPDVLAQIADECGIERDAFAAALEQVDVDAHVAAARRFMARVGARGFPTFVLEIDGELMRAPNERFVGNAAGFAAWLDRTLTEHAAARA